MKEPAYEGSILSQPDSNIASWNKAKKGDIKKGFEEADVIVESEISLPQVAHVPIETHVAVAKADPFSNKVKIWSSLQSPFTTREMLAQALGIPRGDLEITVPYVGGGFGGKAGVHLELLVVLLSRAANGRPVKLRATREEEFNQLPTRAAMRGG